MRQRIRVILADEHLLVRDALRLLLDAECNIEVVASVGNGRAAVHTAGQYLPDLVVMEARLPLLDGAKAARQIKACAPTAKLLVLSEQADRHHVRELLAAGATGYVLKGSCAGALLWAARHVATGGVYLDSQLSPDAVRGLSLVNKRDGSVKVMGLMNDDGEQESKWALGAATEGVRPLEMCVLWYSAQGYTNKEMARRLSLSVKTIEKYRSRAMQTLGLISRVNLMNYAIQKGWFSGVSAPY